MTKNMKRLKQEIIHDAPAVIGRLAKIDRAVLVCDSRSELSDSLFERYEMCRSMHTPVALVLANVANLVELEISESSLDAVVARLCQTLLKVTRMADVIVQYSRQSIALLLVNCDQFNATVVVSRIKESVARQTYLSREIAEDVEFDFGIADDLMEEDHSINSLIARAEAALARANEWRGGAVVRYADLSEGPGASLPVKHQLPGHH